MKLSQVTYSQRVVLVGLLASSAPYDSRSTAVASCRRKGLVCFTEGNQLDLTTEGRAIAEQLDPETLKSKP